MRKLTLKERDVLILALRDFQQVLLGEEGSYHPINEEKSDLASWLADQVNYLHLEGLHDDNP